MEIVVAAGLAAVVVWLALGDRGLARLRPPRASPLVGSGFARWLRGQFGTRADAARARAIRDEVPVVCDLLAVCVESGLPVRGALRVVAEASGEPTRGVLLGVWNQIELGVDEREAWSSLAEVGGYRGMARDLARSLRMGTALGDRLRAHAIEARTAVAVASRARARQASVTGVIPLVACFLPAFLLVGVVPIFGGLIGHLFG